MLQTLRHLAASSQSSARYATGLVTGSGSSASTQAGCSSWEAVQRMYSSESSLFTPYIDPDYTELTKINVNVFQGNKRVSKGAKRARKGLAKGPDRTLRRETIPVPKGVEVMRRGTSLYFSGPLGVNAIDLQKMDTEGLAAFRLGPKDGGGTDIEVLGPSSAFVGTVSSLIKNKIIGVERGYLMYLQLVGVGYRVTKETRDVTYAIPASKQLA